MKKSVSFKNSNFNLAGNLYLPSGMDETQSYPAIICVHPGGGVKEQTAGLYAQKLADQGFIALAYDASHQGESGGEPRFLENPTARVEDIRCAVDYMTTLPYVNNDRIGVLGICAGGGYSINAAQTEKRIKALTTISAVDIGAMFRGDGTEGGTKATLETLKLIGAQRTAEANGADPMYITFVPETKEEINENTSNLMTEAYDYYRTPRAQHPNSANRLLFSGCDKLLAFTAFDNISTLLTQPILLIAGSKADTRAYSEHAYSLANEPKEIFFVEGATHIALYDIPEYVNQAVDKMTQFYKENL